MATRGLWGLLISLIFNFIITLCPLLLLLLLYFFFTPFGIGGRRVTPSWSRAALRAFLPQAFLHGPQSGGVVPSLGPPLGGGFVISSANLHPHHLDRQKDMEVRDDQEWRHATLVVLGLQCEPRILREKSGDSRYSGESGFFDPGVSGFRSRNPKSQCSKIYPSKLRGNADLESMEYFLPIPYEDTSRTTLGKLIGRNSFECTLRREERRLESFET
jgi:hypothetical protein